MRIKQTESLSPNTQPAAKIFSALMTKWAEIEEHHRQNPRQLPEPTGETVTIRRFSPEHAK